MEVHDDHVIFKSGDTSRKAFSTREGRTLLQAAMSLSAYSLAVQDLTISFVSANRFGTQKCFLHITMCYKVQGHHVPVRCCVYIYIYIAWIYPRQALKELCKKAGVRVSGSMPELKSRLIEHCMLQIDEDMQLQ